MRFCGHKQLEHFFFAVSIRNRATEKGVLLCALTTPYCFLHPTVCECNRDYFPTVRRCTFGHPPALRPPSPCSLDRTPTIKKSASPTTYSSILSENRGLPSAVLATIFQTTFALEFDCHLNPQQSNKFIPYNSAALVFSYVLWKNYIQSKRPKGRLHCPGKASKTLAVHPCQFFAAASPASAH